MTEITELPFAPLEAITADFLFADKLMAGSDICVQCGVCLSVCPTYQQTGEEIQSPRGRVMLYRAAAEGLTHEYEVVLEAAYDCLDCRACQTVCPSGVKPGEMAVEARIAMQDGKAEGPVVKAALELFKHPWLVDVANAGTRFYQLSGLQRLVRGTKLLERASKAKLPFAKTLFEMESLLPNKTIAPALRTRVPVVSPATGEKRGTVVFFLGCVMNMVFSEASAATIRVLNQNGFDVITPRDTTCCGAPHIEEGDWDGFRQVATRNLDLYRQYLGNDSQGNPTSDAIITDCAACGAELKKYKQYFSDQPAYSEQAKLFSSRAAGLSEFLKRHGLRDLPSPDEVVGTTSVTYQDACHLCHAQSVCNQPRELLQANPVVEYIELAGASDCCGSAGVYNITHPEQSQVILKSKMEKVRASGASILAVENPGCLLQLDAGTRRYNVDVEVLHTSQVLEKAYRERSVAKK
jgi:glycolate oxidase iron-sulfur subunit